VSKQVVSNTKTSVILGGSFWNLDWDMSLETLLRSSKEMVETRLNYAELPSSTTFNFIYALINMQFDDANLSY